MDEPSKWEKSPHFIAITENDIRPVPERRRSIVTIINHAASPQSSPSIGHGCVLNLVLFPGRRAGDEMSLISARLPAASVSRELILLSIGLVACLETVRNRDYYGLEKHR